MGFLNRFEYYIKSIARPLCAQGKSTLYAPFPIPNDVHLNFPLYLTRDSASKI